MTEKKTLDILNPQLAKEWHPTKNGDLKPEYFTASSNLKVWWQCSKNPKHEWKTSVNSRTSNTTGCPICSGHKVLPGENDLETLNPQVAKEWHPTKNGDLKPSVVAPGCNEKVWWKCEKGHEWEAKVNNRTSKGTSCPHCLILNKKGK